MRWYKASSILLLASIGLSACNESVYYPMPHTVPLVAAGGEAEVGVGIDQNLGATASLAASPVKYLLATGAGSTNFGRLQERKSGQRVQRQWEAGLGGYILLRRSASIGLLAGYGQG